LWKSQYFSENVEKYLKLLAGASRGTRMQTDMSDKFLGKGCEVVRGVGSVDLNLIT
jgi:hypothetical protein